MLIVPADVQFCEQTHINFSKQLFLFDVKCIFSSYLGFIMPASDCVIQMFGFAANTAAMIGCI